MKYKKKIPTTNRRVERTLVAYIAFVAFCSFAILGYFALFYPLKYRTEILSASTEFSIAPDLISSVINAESRFRPAATSHAGAIGLMQVLPSTAAEVAATLSIPDFTADDLYDPSTNIQIGAYYLHTLIGDFGDTATAICAYNAGPNKVRTWLADPRYSHDSAVLYTTPYPETNAYLSKILHYQKIYANYF